MLIKKLFDIQDFFFPGYSLTLDKIVLDFDSN